MAQVTKGHVLAWGASVYHSFCCVILVGIVLTGFAIAFVLPPFMVPDEIAHWSLGLRRLNTALTGDPQLCAPATGLEAALRVSNIPFHFGVKWSTGGVQALAYAPAVCAWDDNGHLYGNLLTYPMLDIVGAAAHDLRSITGDAALHLFWTARLASGLLICGLLLRILAQSRSLAQRGVVPGVLSLLVVCSSPLFLQQSFAISADPLTNAAILALAIVFIAGPKALWWELALCALLGIAAACTKPIIVPLYLAFGPAALLLYPKPADDRPRYRDPRWLAAFVGVAVTVAGCGNIVTTLLAHNGTVHGAEASVDIGKQLHYILGNMGDTLSTLWTAIGVQAGNPVQWISPLGWLDTRLPHILQIRWTALLATAVAVDLLIAASLLTHRALQQPRIDRKCVERGVGAFALLAAALVGFLLLTNLAMFLAWTPVGLDAVHGLQTRYYFPAALLGAVVLAPVSQWLDGSRVATPLPSTFFSKGLLVIPVAGLGLLIVDNLVWVVGTLFARYY